MKTKFNYRGSYLSYVVTYFSFFFAMSAVNNMISLYLTDALGKSDREMTFILSASSLFGILSNPIIGYLNDKFRRPKVLAASLLTLAAVCAVIFSVSKNTIVLYALNGLMMGSVSAVSPISERVASSGKFRYGKIRVWGTIGYAAAPPVAGAIMELMPQGIFIAAAVALAIGAVSYLFLQGISFDTGSSGAKGDDIPVANRFDFLKNPAFLLFLLITMIYLGTSGLNNAYCPMLLQSLGLSSGTVGTVLSIGIMLELPIVLFSNHFMDRFSSKTLTIVSIVLMLIEYIVYGVCTNLAVVLTTMILLKAICGTIYMMVQLKVIREVVGEGSVSTAQGTLSAIGAVTTIIIQNAGGWLAGIWGMQVLYLVMSAMSVIAVVLCMFLKIKNTEKFFS